MQFKSQNFYSKTLIWSIVMYIMAVLLVFAKISKEHFSKLFFNENISKIKGS